MLEHSDSDEHLIAASLFVPKAHLSGRSFGHLQYTVLHVQVDVIVLDLFDWYY